MASVTYVKCIMANVIMTKIFMAKILWQMKLSQIGTCPILQIKHVASVQMQK